MSTLLFALGAALIAAAAAGALFGNDQSELATLVFGGAGGAAAAVATFWTTPVDKMSDSITDLVKLETAFLGYIRLIGEVDSAFQMQYLDLLAQGPQSNIRLDALTQDTTKFVKEAMEQTVALIDRYVALDGHSIEGLTDRLAALEKQLGAPPQ